MSAYQIVFADKVDSPVWKAMCQVLPLFMNGIIQEEDCLHYLAAHKVSSKERKRIGVAISLGDNEDVLFWNHFSQLERIGCEFFINIVVKSSDHNLKTPPWNSLDPRWRGVCAQRCRASTLDVSSLAAAIQNIISSEFQEIEPLLRPCRPVAEAKELVKALPEFTHGGALDVTNIMLAPARMIYFANSDEKQKQNAWDLWAAKSWLLRKKVCVKLESCRNQIMDNNANNHLAIELFQSWKEIQLWLGKEKPECRFTSTREIVELERMMGLLTDIRLIGKGIPGDSKSQSCNCGIIEDTLSIQIGEKKDNQGFRILVVDDHANCWRDVINLAVANAQKKLNRSVTVDFSLGGLMSKSGDKKHWKQLLLNYDLLLLDVFLPGGEKGTSFLHELRQNVNWLPVLLWTTSLSSELAGSAALHNGYLFKKSISVEELSKAFEAWLPIGSSRRHYSLPNRLFNYTIQKQEYRKLAVEFHEWCLKQLDSFHALDGEYFRFFTDHGGRHIVKLWELLEQALQPFLQSDLVLPAPDNPDREKELLALNLAVVCHELGMFPMSIGGKVEDFSKLGADYLDDVRSLHAVRGMVLLKAGKHWNDKAGEKLWQALDSLQGGIIEHLSVLIGYHARVFKSMSPEAFLKWEILGESNKGAKYDLDERLSKLATPVPSLSRTDEAFKECFETLSNHFESDETARNRLRRQCALFRFIDALDVTYTRNPADFLLGSGKLNAISHREHLKRSLCLSAKIEGGKVCVRMLASAPPRVTLIKIFERLETMMLNGIRTLADSQSFLNNQDASNKNVSEPWNLDLDNAIADHGRLEILKTKSVLMLQKPLDFWLKAVWKVLMGDKLDSEFIKHLKLLEILDNKLQEPKLTVFGAQTIASITALSVAGELLDEYQAIVEAGLSDKISLAPFGWDPRMTWTEIPSGLTSLNRLVQQ